MLALIKQGLKRIFNMAGLEVRRFHPEESQLARLVTVLRHIHADVVFDVGANEGQFSRELRAGGYHGRIISFEPLSEAFSKLSLASVGDEKWEIHPRCAIGSREGEVEINISSNSVSSSILPMLSAHSEAAPGSVYLGREKVSITTLDIVAPQYLDGYESVVLKIDTQGYELQVLDGASKILPYVKAILMEVSFVPLYGGQSLWNESIEYLQSKGFELWALEPVFVDPKTGRILQMDALFVHE